jgi:GTPase SAR1 family protein
LKYPVTIANCIAEDGQAPEPPAVGLLGGYMTDKPYNFELVFTPGAPIQSKRLLFGREQEINDIQRLCRRPGLHPVVIGYRGVGKTSLVLQAFSHSKSKVIRINCGNTIRTFQTLSENILRELEVDVSTMETTKVKETEFTAKGSIEVLSADGKAKSSESVRRIEIGQRKLDPWTMYTIFKEMKKKVFIIIDEYDALPYQSEEPHASIAELMKTLADHSNECETRLLIVGVAQSAKELLGTHESIERSAREIYLRPLRREDIMDFLNEAESIIKLIFQHEVKELIVKGSMGFPYYLHLIGLECIDAMIRRQGKKVITMEDYRVAIKMAVDKAFRSELNKYKRATDGLVEKEINLLKEIVLMGGNPSRKDLEIRINRKNIMNIGEYNTTLLKLQQEKRFIYISRNDDTIRFCDPLLYPFLRDKLFLYKENIILPLFPNY